MRRISLKVLGIVALLAGFALPARAETVNNPPPDWDTVAAKGAQALLEAADKVEYGGRNTQVVDTDLLVYDTPRGEPRRQNLVMYEKSGQRLLKFTAPADVAGTAILVKDTATMYIYLPQYDRVRRVATSNRKQTFLGSDFSFDDMAVSNAAPLYNAKLVEMKADGAVLDLTAKPGADVVYPRMRVTIAKPLFYMSRAEFFDEAGRHVRTRERKEPTVFENGWRSCKRQIMIDHTNRDHRSELVFKSLKANTDDVTDDMFSKRSLVRGF